MLNSQFLDRGPVFSIFQKSNTEAVQASLNSSLRVWQSLLGSVAGCWLPARIMNQTAQAARIWCAHLPVSALHSHLPKQPVLQHLSSLPLHLPSGLLLEEVGSRAWGWILSFSKPHPCSYNAMPSTCHTGVQPLLLVLQKDRTRAPHLSDSLCWLKLAAFLKIITASGNYYN